MQRNLKVGDTAFFFNPFRPEGAIFASPVEGITQSDVGEPVYKTHDGYWVLVEHTYASFEDAFHANETLASMPDDRRMLSVQLLTDALREAVGEESTEILIGKGIPK